MTRWWRSGVMVAALISIAALPTNGAAHGGGGLIGILAPNGAGRVLSIKTESVRARITGGLVVAFHGDPAAGCAAHGLCGYSGTITWTPATSASLEFLRIRTTKRTVSTIDVFDNGYGPAGSGDSTYAHVEQSSLVGSSCTDLSSGRDDFGFAAKHGHVRIGLTGAPLLQTRCAGPLVSDIRSALPSRPRTVRSVLHGETTIDLSRSGSFASHGFAGTVTSTVKLVLGKAGRLRSQNLNPHLPGKTERIRYVTARYRGTVGGQEVTSFSGDENSVLCAPLGSCGAQGTMSQVIGSPHVDGTLVAFGPATRPYRDFLTALGIGRGGRSDGIRAFGDVSWDGAGSLAEDLRQGAVRCRDRSGAGGGSVQIDKRHGVLSAAYSPFLYDSARTRCPGPIAPRLELAGRFEPTGPSTRSAMLTFNRSGRFTDDGYTGSVSPHVTLHLRRTRVSSEFEEVPTGFGFSRDRAALRSWAELR